MNIFEYFQSHIPFFQGKVLNYNDSFSTKTGIFASRCSINCWKKPIWRDRIWWNPWWRWIDQYRKWSFDVRYQNFILIDQFDIIASQENVYYYLYIHLYISGKPKLKITEDYNGFWSVYIGYGNKRYINFKFNERPSMDFNILNHEGSFKVKDDIFGSRKYLHFLLKARRHKKISCANLSMTISILLLFRRWEPVTSWGWNSWGTSVPVLCLGGDNENEGKGHA